MITTTEAIWAAAIVAFSLVAIIYDLRWRRIPNGLTVPALVLGLLFHAATAGGAGLLVGLGGFATGFGLLFLMWLTGSGAGGDVKLMGALGAWLGARLTVYALVGSAVFVAFGGSAVLLAALVCQGPLRFRRRYVGSAGDAPRAKARRGLMPFALPLTLATWAIVAWQVLAPHAHRAS
jgi:prepilin peptidase CpaA